MRRLRGLLAAVAVAALVVGLPVALVIVIGDPAPTHLPSWSQVHVAVASRNVASSTWVKLIADVAWLVWARLVWVFASEAALAIAAHRAQRVYEPRRGASPIAMLVASIAAGLWVSVPSIAFAATPTRPRAAVSALAPPELLRPGATSPPRGATVSSAQGAKAAAPATATQAPPANGTESSTLLSSVKPKEATCTVVEYDDLWALAVKHYGTGLAWKVIWNANKDRVMNDGRVFNDQNLIYPGWVLILPASSSAVPGSSLRPGTAGTAGASATPTPSSARPAPPVASPPTTPAPTPTSTAHNTAATHNGTAIDNGTAVTHNGSVGSHNGKAATSDASRTKSTPAAAAQPSVTGTRSSSSATRATSNATPGHVVRQQAKDAAAAEHWRGELAGLGVGLLAVGIGVELARRRRRRMRSVSPEHRILLPTGGAARVERRLAHSADLDGASWVDLGLRRLGAALREAGVGGGAPVITGVRLSAGTLIVEAASPTPDAAPFVAKASTWRLSRTALEALVGSSFEPTPTPCLVSLGRSDTNEVVLVNLEAHGVVGVVGEDDHVGGAIRAMAVELATCAWAEYEELILVGVAPELACLSRVRVCEVLDEALITDLSRWAEVAEAALGADGWASLSQARVIDAEHDLRWGPMVVIVGPGLDTAALEPLAGRPGVVVVRPGEAEGAWVLRAEGGRLSAPDGGSMMAQELNVTEAGAVGELLAQAESPAEVEPTSHPYDAIGPRELATADVAASSAAVEIGVLGPVTCSAGEAARNKEKAAELLAYLVCHPEGVSPGAWEVALWRDPVTTGHRRNVLSCANQALGRAASGEALILTTDSRVRLAPEVGCDWSRFRALSKGTPEHWRQALELVRGRPFEDLDATWTLAEGHATEIEQHILGVAVRLAEHYLAMGDHGGVEWATKVGLSISAWDERLYRVKMASAARSGGRNAAEGIFQQLRAAVASGEDPMVVIELETLELYRSFNVPASR